MDYLKKAKKTVWYRALIHFVVFSLLVIVIGKGFFRSPKNVWLDVSLYVYGVAVTVTVLSIFFIAFVRYRDPYEDARQMPKTKKEKPLVSLLVAVRNEEKVIDLCVQSLINQWYHNKEIIVINDASTDSTKQILNQYARKGLISVIHLSKNVGKKKALAQGMLRAGGEIFVFTDSDSVLAVDAVSKVVRIFNSNQLIGAVSGHVRALNGDHNLLTKIQDSWYEGQFSVRKAFESHYGAVTCVSGPLAGFRREAIFNFIPAWENDKFLGQEFRFATDRTLTGFVLGSMSIGEKIKKKYHNSPFVTRADYPAREWKVVYSKSARAWTVVPDTFAKLLKQQVRWKKSFVRNIFFTGFFYWKKPFLASLFYYFHIVFVFAGPFIAFRHMIYFPSQGSVFAALLYLGGIIYVGFMFGLAFKLENRESHKWMYRPLMSLMSTLLFSWLIFYSIVTIKKMIWSRG